MYVVVVRFVIVCLLFILQDVEDKEFYVGGVDISFVKDDTVNACAALVVMSFPSLMVSQQMVQSLLRFSYTPQTKFYGRIFKSVGGYKFFPSSHLFCLLSAHFDLTVAVTSINKVSCNPYFKGPKKNPVVGQLLDLSVQKVCRVNFFQPCNKLE